MRWKFFYCKIRHWLCRYVVHKMYSHPTTSFHVAKFENVFYIQQRSCSIAYSERKESWLSLDISLCTSQDLDLTLYPSDVHFRYQVHPSIRLQPKRQNAELYCSCLYRSYQKTEKSKYLLGRFKDAVLLHYQLLYLPIQIFQMTFCPVFGSTTKIWISQWVTVTFLCYSPCRPL